MNIIIVIFSLVFLITLHELGHFFFAKRFGVEVEEFGIGIPPRVWGKKIGETIYSLNLIPFGGFVRMTGEHEKVNKENSFSEKPIWQRAIIIVAGVVSFWIVAALIFSSVFYFWGTLTYVGDDPDVEDAMVLVTGANTDSDLYGEIMIQDRIIEVNGKEIEKTRDLVEGLENITIKRGKEIKTIDLEGRGEEFLGSFGIGRYTEERMDFLPALRAGPVRTFEISKMQVVAFGQLIKGALSGEGIPEGMEVGGPVMIGSLATQALDRGVGDYLYFVAFIASVLAVINILPIPALDGGRLLFLMIEKIKGGPIPEKAETMVNAFFFVLLILLILVVTARDIYRMFI